MKFVKFVLVAFVASMLLAGCSTTRDKDKEDTQSHHFDYI